MSRGTNGSSKACPALEPSLVRRREAGEREGGANRRAICRAAAISAFQMGRGEVLPPIPSCMVAVRSDTYLGAERRSV